MGRVGPEGMTGELSREWSREGREEEVGVRGFRRLERELSRGCEMVDMAGEGVGSQDEE